MNVSYEWLRALAPGLDEAPEALAHRLALRGAPVDSVTALAEGLEDVVVARVEATEPHPNADRLTMCSVDSGSGALLRVVCGAPNVRVGALYPFARVGTILPGDVKIKKAKIRGESSEGMLCSAQELRLGHDHSGLLELSDSAIPGASVVEALSLRDYRFDVEVTANRGDLLSHLGIAREVAPGGHASLRLPEIPGATGLKLERIGDPREVATGGTTVRVEDPDLCFRYLGAVVRGVTVDPSPDWLQVRLRAVGARPINNVVDATNYVLLEVGQPLHAFDLGKLAQATVVVRRARAEETTFRTLDGVARTIGPEMLMICDAERPVAVAGVMGGLDSEVTSATTDLLLECALFEPKAIRATRRALGVSTDASYRFERGVDPEGLDGALERAIEIILAVAGGQAEAQVADCHPAPFTRVTVELRPERVERVLGVAFAVPELHELLEPLGFVVSENGGGTLGVEVPGFRSHDVTREIDLVEEVARTHGFDAFPATLRAFRPGTVPDNPLFQLEDRVRDLLAGRGLYEAHTPAFVGERQGEIRLPNPISAEEAYLRSTLLPSLCRRAEYNWSRGTKDVRLFELATAFSRGSGEQPISEEPRLAALLTGRRARVHFSEPAEPFVVWDLKGLLEDAACAAWPAATVAPGAPDGYGLVRGDGFTVSADGGVVGWGGQVAAEDLDAPPWADPVWGLELRLPDEPVPGEPTIYQPLAPFPAVERDLALVVPDGVPAVEVEAEVRARGGALLRGISMFDYYRGKGVPEGYRSLAYRLRFLSLERTLTDDEIDSVVARVVDHLREALGVERRG